MLYLVSKPLFPHPTSRTHIRIELNINHIISSRDRYGYGYKEDFIRITQMAPAFRPLNFGLSYEWEFPRRRPYVPKIALSRNIGLTFILDDDIGSERWGHACPERSLRSLRNFHYGAIPNFLKGDDWLAKVGRGMRAWEGA